MGPSSIGCGRVEDHQRVTVEGEAGLDREGGQAGCRLVHPLEAQRQAEVALPVEDGAHVVGRDRPVAVQGRAGVVGPARCGAHEQGEGAEVLDPRVRPGHGVVVVLELRAGRLVVTPGLRVRHPGIEPQA